MRQGREDSAFEKFLNTRPRAVSLSGEALVRTSAPERELPLVMRPASGGLDLCEWACANRGFIETELHSRGAILFRDFGVEDESAFRRFAKTVAPELLDYHEPSSPRTEVGDKIYTSTEYPAEERIALHNELSYSRAWPLKIFFYCDTPAARGGETPVADSRRVFEALDASLKKRFTEKGVMYVRNFREGIGLNWQQVFRTTDRSAAEAHFKRAGMSHEWFGDGRLKVVHVRPATATHPRTLEEVWFNQAHLFHVSSVGAAAEESLRALFKEDELPSNAYYGDGSPIEASALEEVRGAYEQASSSFTWRKGDVLLLDNMLAAHGRAPFEGARRILVAMAEPSSD